MTIAPIVRTVEVKADPARAFALFAGQIGRWWPKRTSVGANPHVDVVIEPRVGGRWYEKDADGVETQWGHVMDWAPPGRILLAWQLNSQFTYDADLITEVEVTFAPRPGGGALVTLEHRHLERYGADAEKIAAQLGGGWPTMLGHFADHVAAQV
jgi:hypothetical protein